MKHSTKILLAIAGLVISSASYAGGGYGHRGYGHHGGGHHGHGSSIAGAIIVGGLLGYALTEHRYREPRTVYRTVYVDRPAYHEPTRFFRRESDGNCYLINYRENGDQVLTIVPALNCE